MNCCGYPIYIFEDPPEDDFLICPLCMDVLREPVQCPNGHCFCRACISLSLQSREECPNCRIPLNSHQLSISLLVRKIIGERRVRCSGGSNNAYETVDEALARDLRCSRAFTVTQGCTWIGQLQYLDSHRQHECQYRMIECPNDGCTVMISHILLSDHLSECLFRTVLCDYCGVDYKFTYLAGHIVECNERPVECPNACGVTCIRSELLTHQEECPLEFVACPYAAVGCEPDCDGTLARQDVNDHIMSIATVGATVSAIVQELVISRRKIESIENTVVALRKRLRTVRKENHLLQQTNASAEERITILESQAEVLRLKTEIAELAEVYNAVASDTCAALIKSWLHRILSDLAVGSDHSHAHQLIRQLQLKKQVDGQLWMTFHVAVQLRNFDPLENTVSEIVTLCSGVKASIKLKPRGPNHIDFYGHLQGFRGEGEITLCLLRFGHGKPRCRTVENCTWTKDQGWGVQKFVTKNILLNSGFLADEDESLRCLATFVLCMH